MPAPGPQACAGPAPWGAQHSLCCEQQQQRQSKAPSSSSSSHPALGKPVLFLPSSSQALLHPPNTLAQACKDCTRVPIGKTSKSCTHVQTGTKVQILHTCTNTVAIRTRAARLCKPCTRLPYRALPGHHLIQFLGNPDQLLSRPHAGSSQRSRLWWLQEQIAAGGRGAGARWAQRAWGSGTERSKERKRGKEKEGKQGRKAERRCGCPDQLQTPARQAK